MKKSIAILLTGILVLTVFISCGNQAEELTLEEAQALKEENRGDLLSRTVVKPGNIPYEIGLVGGVWYDTITSDPKTFNTLTARDGASREIIDTLYQSLQGYDPYKREFYAEIAEADVRENTDGTMDVYYTLRDDLYWTTPDGKDRVKVTSDDAVFWYDEIDGDATLQLPGYPGQFITMPDGTEKRITIHKINSRTFYFHIPRIIANPVLSTNTTFGPMYIFKETKEKSGIEGLLELFNIETDVNTLPSIGPYHITEYTPGVRVVKTRNPWYWKKDENGETLPYVEKIIMKIVPDDNTQYLIFKKGETEAHSVKPENLEELINSENKDYTVYNGGANLSAGFITFNQNPDNLDSKYLGWFSKKEFRQAISCLLNRDRVIKQVYRGLAEPALHFFATANPFFDETIKMQYTYDPQKAIKLLSSIGITPDDQGYMTDDDGNRVSFDLNMGIEGTIGIDIANILSDEASKIGLTINVKPIDFQKLVDMLMNTYDWQTAMVSLGTNYWPTSGSNVWPSKGNFHLWHPLQEEPATDWEARIDELYETGTYTTNTIEAKKIWDEYQNILLEELPVIYLFHSISFLAIKDKWGNVSYDNLSGLGGLEAERIYDQELKP